MKTNDIKKGMRILLSCGWKATMLDNKKGNIRLAEVEGIFTEIGSVYSHDITHCMTEIGGDWVKVNHTDSQKELKNQGW